MRPYQWAHTSEQKRRKRGVAVKKFSFADDSISQIFESVSERNSTCPSKSTLAPCRFENPPRSSRHTIPFISPCALSSEPQQLACSMMCPRCRWRSVSTARPSVRPSPSSSLPRRPTAAHRWTFTGLRAPGKGETTGGWLEDSNDSEWGDGQWTQIKW